MKTLKQFVEGSQDGLPDKFKKGYMSPDAKARSDARPLKPGVEKMSALDKLRLIARAKVAK